MISEKKTEKVSLLLAEDEELLSLSITDFLEPRGYKVYRTDKCSEAIDILKQHNINLALVDIKLSDGEGTVISEYILKNNLKIKVILMTAYGPQKKIREYIQKGTFDFLEKPFAFEKLLKRIENAYRMFQLEYSHDAAETYKKSSYQIVGTSQAIKNIKKMISLVAPSMSSVLIEGETGTGKELIARNIHLESDRYNKQFISVNCASIPENLFESEFFGYEKGAFTGAFKEKPGFFEIANFGVLHLDEIGEMPIEFQAKLLRVLEEGSYIKLGGTKEIQVDVRIITSTNKNLKEEVAAERFREDLYFRIAVFNIYIPPLRKRREDIPLIAEHLWNDMVLKMGIKKSAPVLSFEDLKHHHWRGNVRELRNHLEKKLIYSRLGESIQAGLKPPLPDEADEVNIIPLEDCIRQYVVSALRKFNDNKTKAAEALGISLSTLKRKLKKWEI
jgi:DNA-binding NtrC family response regulator